MASNWLSAPWQILGMSSHSIVSYSYCPMVGMRNVLFSAVGGMTIHLPNGGFWLAVHWQLVRSSIVGPMGKASKPGPLMVTLPMEVVTVSM